MSVYDEDIDVRQQTPVENALSSLIESIRSAENELEGNFELGVNSLKSWNGLVFSLEFLILQLKRFDVSFDLSFYGNGETVPTELNDMIEMYQLAIKREKPFRLKDLTDSSPTDSHPTDDDIPF